MLEGIDFSKLETTAQQTVDYARELGEWDPDGMIRVWVHSFNDTDPDKAIVYTKIGHELNLNLRKDKQTSGTYYIDTHPDTKGWGIFYQEPSGGA